MRIEEARSSRTSFAIPTHPPFDWVIYALRYVSEDMEKGRSVEQWWHYHVVVKYGSLECGLRREMNWCKSNAWWCKIGINLNAQRALIVWLWVRKRVWTRLNRGQPERRIAGGWAGGNPWEELLPGEKPVRKNTAGRATREKNCKEPQRTEKWEEDVRRVIVSVLMDCDAATSWWWSASLMI